MKSRVLFATILLFSISQRVHAESMNVPPQMESPHEKTILWYDQKLEAINKTPVQAGSEAGIRYLKMTPANRWNPVMQRDAINIGTLIASEQALKRGEEFTDNEKRTVKSNVADYMSKNKIEDYKKENTDVKANPSFSFFGKRIFRD